MAGALAMRPPSCYPPIPMGADLHVVPSGVIDCNSIVLWDEDSKEAVIIDPTDDASTALSFVEQHQLKLVAILLTHGHFDHAADAEHAMTASGKPCRLHRLDHDLYYSLPQEALGFGIRVAPRKLPLETIAEGDELRLGEGVTLKTLHVPGHTEGSVAFFVAEGPWVFSGDALFAGSVGRTDLRGGNFEALRDSIRNKLYQLPDECVVVPGHGPPTTIGEEKRHNPFVRAG